MTEEPDKIYVTRVEFRQNKFEGGYDTNIFVITGLYKHKDLNEEFYQVKVKLRPVSLQTLRYISFMKETDAINKVKETFKIARIVLFARNRNREPKVFEIPYSPYFYIYCLILFNSKQEL